MKARMFSKCVLIRAFACVRGSCLFASLVANNNRCGLLLCVKMTNNECDT